MGIRKGYPQAKLPSSHYFLTVSRGESVRALAVRPTVAWAGIIVLPLAVLWATATTAYIAMHDDVVSALFTRAAQIETDYQVKLADTRAELDRVSSRQMLDQNAFEGRMHELLSRQARLEQRDAMLAALAKEAGAQATALAEARSRAGAHPATALSAIQAIGGGAPSDGDLGAARAYAPFAAPGRPVAKPRPLDPGPDSLGAAAPVNDKLTGELTAAAADVSLDPNARLGLVDYSLDRVERAQVAAVAGVAKAARVAAQRFESIIDRTGLSASDLKAPEGGVGGPYVPAPADASAFGRAVSDASRDIAAAARLRRLMPHLPLAYPLQGQASMSSPFGYRPDPFLGRPALHPGVDLVQAYGAEIKATGIGKITHAGPMGGYGNCVEIDHGNGIATRFGHMSETLVEVGQSVKPGDAIGRIGSTGRSTGPHLHYEVRVDGEAVDPERFLTAERE